MTKKRKAAEYVAPTDCTVAPIMLEAGIWSQFLAEKRFYTKGDDRKEAISGDGEIGNQRRKFE